jgi:chitin-binding protein
MTAYRLIRPRVGLAVAALVAIGAGLAPAAPAQAHGATSAPVSRAVACAPDSGRADSAACRAAVADNGGRRFDDWDNVRVANVRGRDRQRIPDGRLCSGGLDSFRGLDLARADWPATTVSAGARFTFRYRQRIPHQGTFKLYATTDGYVPTRPLRWSDLAARPFLTATDPPMRGDAYEIAGRLPQGRTGRHIIFAIWQNTDTPDTYYSCSDVVFKAARGGAGPAGATRATESARPAGSPAGSGVGVEPTTGAEPTSGVEPSGSAVLGAPATRPVASVLTPTTGAFAALALVVGVGLITGLAVRRRRRQR